jgi:hypothetical protein
LLLGVNDLNLSWEESLLLAAGTEVSTGLILLSITVLVLEWITFLACVARGFANTTLTGIWVVAYKLLIVACSACDVTFFLKSN